MIHKHPAAEVLARLDIYDALIDARSESEYALDHLPGARNWPTLNDAERALVGTEYKQVSPFTARKRGAAMAARNIAAHIDRELGDTPKDWKPLIYCWRGGQRSGALATVLDAIGFSVTLLDGGYRAYRRAVIEALEALPQRYDWRVVCGSTGSGKSQLLRVMAGRGAQVLDLEALAQHRGSVLGLVPGEKQPSQKHFESQLWDTLRRFDASRPVFVESESRKVGDLRVPEALIERMREAPCLVVDLPVEARVTLLMDEYRFFVDDIGAFCSRLDALRVLRGHETINRWQAAARGGAIAGVVRELLEQHYDPIYRQSIGRNYRGSAAPRATLAWDGSAASLDTIAAQAIEAA